MSPAVSVIIPTYNHRDFVLETLESVFAQTFTDCEIIVVNDGSPDDTAKVLIPLVGAGRIRYFEQANAGQAAARNRGLAEAKGQFIAFLDDDDLWPPDKLEWQTARLREHLGAVLVYGPESRIGTDEPNEPAAYPSGDVWKNFVVRNFILSPGQTLIRKSALEKIGGFDADIWGADDWELYIRLAKVGTFSFDSRIALRYRLHQSNASRDVERMMENVRRVRKKHLSPLPLPTRLRLMRESAVFWGFLFASAYREQGRNDAARRIAIRTLPWLRAPRERMKVLLYYILPDRCRGLLRRIGLWR